MSDASLSAAARRLARAQQEASLAGHEMAARRWGSQRLERLAAELVERRDELDPERRRELASALADSNDSSGDAA